MSGLRDAENPFEHYVYRIYDKSGQLLYIGCSMEPEHRMEWHRVPCYSKAPYAFGLAEAFDHFTVSEPYPDKSAARAAERAAIADEAPLFNIQHQRKYAADLPKYPAA